MIYIIRHGETEMNNKKALQGRSNFPLNEAGTAQAKEAAVKLQGVRFSKVYCPFRNCHCAMPTLLILASTGRVKTAAR